MNGETPFACIQRISYERTNYELALRDVLAALESLGRGGDTASTVRVQPVIERVRAALSPNNSTHEVA